MEQFNLFQELLVVVWLSIAVVFGLRRIGLPSILGYLVTGVLVSASTLGSSGGIGNTKILEILSHFGVVFLLFSIGLELSLQKLISMRRALLGLGGLQVLLCTGCAFAIGYYAGLPVSGAIAVAGAISLSSTAVVTKQLVEQGEMHNLSGRVTLSILLFQDLAAVPFLIIIPALATGGTSGSIGNQLLSLSLIGIIIFFAMLAAGRWMLRPLFQNIAGTQSSELFMITALVVALTSGGITQQLGLSMEFGAFLAGVMLAETEYAHQIESDIRPFRDILLGLFFVGVGLKLHPMTLINETFTIAALVISIILFKTIVIALLSIFVGKIPTKTAIKTGLTLAQGGEFGFALLSLAFDHNVLDAHTNQIVIAAIIISIGIAPLLIRYGHIIAEFLTREHEEKIAKFNIMSASSTTDDITDHVIICGYGHVGQTLAKFLEQEGIPFIGLDIDPLKIGEASAAGEPVFYGDAANQEVLLSAGLTKAKLLVVTFDNHLKTKRVLKTIRKYNKKLLSLVSARDDSHLNLLQQAGATEVIPEKLEVSLMIASHMLMFLGHAPNKVQQQIQDVRNYRYNMLRAYFHGVNDVPLDGENVESNVLHAIKITQNSYAIGKSLQDIFNDGVKINITAFYRNGFKCNDAPTSETILHLGDVLVVKGTKEETYLAEEMLVQGI